MTPTAPPKSFVAQMKDFFGLLPGQAAGRFAAEIKALTEQDKRELAAMLAAAGFPCDVPTPHVAA